jgi:Protein of unknown function (DUF2934)
MRLTIRCVPFVFDMDYQEIRKTAYFKWEAAGGPEGRDMEFWLRAETEYARTHGLWDWESSPFKVGDDFLVETVDGTCKKVPKPDGGGSPPSEFLSDISASMVGLREDLWNLFKVGVAHAERLTPAAVKILSVSIGDPDWLAGRIRIPASAQNKGVLFHEVGHSFFEASDFHKNRNDWWGDAFCDAFRYCLEVQFCRVSDWLRHFPNERGGRYQGPADLILAKATTKDFDGLVALWDYLNTRYDGSDEFLDMHFGYTMLQPT